MAKETRQQKFDRLRAEQQKGREAKIKAANAKARADAERQRQIEEHAWTLEQARKQAALIAKQRRENRR